MRLKGTGTDPDHRYAEGLIFDAPPGKAAQMIEDGFATALDPADDTSRTESQVAAAVHRGDNLSNPDDAAAAEGMSEHDALEIVQEGPVDEPVDGGQTLRAPKGVAEAGIAAGPSAPVEAAPEASVEELTEKQKVVEQAKALDVAHSGSKADIEKRIEARKTEIAAAEEAAATAATAAEGSDQAPAEGGDGESSGS